MINVGTLVTTYTILRAPYHDYGIIYPKTPCFVRDPMMFVSIKGSQMLLPCGETEIRKAKICQRYKHKKTLSFAASGYARSFPVA